MSCSVTAFQMLIFTCISIILLHQSVQLIYFPFPTSCHSHTAMPCDLFEWNKATDISADSFMMSTIESSGPCSALRDRLAAVQKELRANQGLRRKYSADDIEDEQKAVSLIA